MIAILMHVKEESCDKAFLSLSPDQKKWLMIVMQELTCAKIKHPEWPDDPVHRAAIIGEESGELLRAALQHHYEGGNLNEMHKEAVQTAATCMRFLIETPFELDEPKQPKHNYEMA